MFVQRSWESKGGSCACRRRTGTGARVGGKKRNLVPYGICQLEQTHDTPDVVVFICLFRVYFQYFQLACADTFRSWIFFLPPVRGICVQLACARFSQHRNLTWNIYKIGLWNFSLFNNAIRFAQSSLRQVKASTKLHKTILIWSQFSIRTTFLRPDRCSFVALIQASARWYDAKSRSNQMQSRPKDTLKVLCLFVCLYKCLVIYELGKYSMQCNGHFNADNNCDLTMRISSLWPGRLTMKLHYYFRELRTNIFFYRKIPKIPTDNTVQQPQIIVGQFIGDERR